MSGPAIDREVIASHGLTEEEYARVVSILGRSPNLLELGIFSVMWSEHCSYKSSRLHLRTLPTKGPHVLQGPGENAGAIDIGEGLAASNINGQFIGSLQELQGGYGYWFIVTEDIEFQFIVPGSRATGPINTPKIK